MVVPAAVTEALGKWLHDTGMRPRPLKQATVFPDLKPLANVELVDHTGAPVIFGSAWESGPALLVFLRHYG